MSDDLTSPEYRSLLRAKHEETRWGDEGFTWAGYVHRFARVDLDARSVLDYGCGRGTLKDYLVGFDVAEYDPGIPGKEAPPAPADLVVATDVLEHVEPEKLDAVLNHIASLARLGAFLVISCRPAREVLADGRNAHLIVQRPQWWVERVKRVEHWSVVDQMLTDRNRELVLWLKKDAP